MRHLNIIFYYFIILAFNFIFINSKKPDCELRINEINAGNPSVDEQLEYIELKVFGICKTHVMFAGWKILFAKGIGGMDRKPVVLGYISLPSGRTKIRSNTLYLIGPDSINPDLSFKSSSVYLRQLYNLGSGINSFIPNRNKVPHAILLLQVDSKDGNIFQNYFQFAKFNRPTTIEGEKNEIIKKYLVDMVVYSRKCAFDSCDIFEEWVPSFKDKNYMLTDFETKNYKDHSLSRCTTSKDPFLPEYFKLGTLTPGKPNDCTGSRFMLVRSWHLLSPLLHVK